MEIIDCIAEQIKSVMTQVCKGGQVSHLLIHLS